jgi:hypothetical protein
VLANDAVSATSHTIHEFRNGREVRDTQVTFRETDANAGGERTLTTHLRCVALSAHRYTSPCSGGHDGIGSDA